MCYTHAYCSVSMVSIGQEAEEYTLEEKASKERLREEEEADGSGKAARLDSSVN